MAKKDRVQEGLELPFKCSKEHWSNYSKPQLVEIGSKITGVLMGPNCKASLLRLDQLGLFNIFIPELTALKKIPQNKQNSKDAFTHSLIVADQIKADPMLKWAALLHDIGKAHYRTNPNGGFDFRGHEFNGAKLAKGILKRMKVSHSGDIYKLVQFHTHPLDYQRQPNWKMTTVNKFVEKYEHLSQPLVDLAIADKIASSNKADYLEELYKLKQMIEEIQYEPKRV